MLERDFSILHLASDEKFINAANYIFEKAFPGSNHFLVPHSRFNRELKFVEKRENVELVPFGNQLISKLSKKTKLFNCVFLHGISEINSMVFLSSEDKAKFIGIFWGAELYTDENFSESRLTGELTSAINFPEPELSMQDRVKNLIRHLVYTKSTIRKDAVKKASIELSYVSSLDEKVFDVLKAKNLISRISHHIPYTYYPLEYIIKGNETAIVNGNNILLGNSASVTNNHLEGFELLKQMKVDSRSIIVPLSYGSSLYADHIEAKGSEMFHGNFKSLRRFISLEEYTRILQTCGLAIMNHYRPQAVGNILTLLWLGTKLYMNESSTFFHFLKRIGIRVFSIEKDLKKENKLALDNLSMEEIEQNREILRETIGEDHVVQRLRESINQFFF